MKTLMQQPTTPDTIGPHPCPDCGETVETIFCPTCAAAASYLRSIPVARAERNPISSTNRRGEAVYFGRVQRHPGAE